MTYCQCSHRALHDELGCTHALGFMEVCPCKFFLPERKLFCLLLIVDGKAVFEIGCQRWYRGWWVRHIVCWKVWELSKT